MPSEHLGHRVKFWWETPLDAIKTVSGSTYNVLSMVNRRKTGAIVLVQVVKDNR